jgi:antibiotic biosynthesis monooxygenase (ABM) superfamily enzyme
MRGDRVAVQEESTRVEDPPVAVNVTRRIKPGRVGEFEEWVSGITNAISRLPGYVGFEVLKPGDPSGTEYHIIYRFERLSDLRRWGTRRRGASGAGGWSPSRTARPTGTS